MAGPIAVDGLPKKLSYIKENIFPVHNQVVKKIDRAQLGIIDMNRRSITLFYWYIFFFIYCFSYFL